MALPVQILRTSTPDAAPSAGSLLPGALAVEMASAAPRLWVGVDPALSYPGNLRLVVDSTGAPFLPLAGGTITPTANSLALDINNTGTGNSLVIRNGATNHLVVASSGAISLGNTTVAPTTLNVTANTTSGTAIRTTANTGVAFERDTGTAFNHAVNRTGVSFSVSFPSSASTGIGFRAECQNPNAKAISILRTFPATSETVLIRGTGETVIGTATVAGDGLTMLTVIANGTGSTALDVRGPIVLDAVAIASLKTALGI